MLQHPDFNPVDINADVNDCYIVIRIDTLLFLVPQTQVYALEPAFDVEYLKDICNLEDEIECDDSLAINVNSSKALGQLQIDDQDYPIYGLSADLKPISKVPETRRICVLFNTPSQVFGLLADQVVLLEFQEELNIRKLPICMQTGNSRIRGLVLKDQDVLCVIEAIDILAYCTNPVIEEQYG
ncbi:hypothetical protein TI04_01575 [Achromatium sp. WMS2]|nr:hypothetical protein TI04_01575 [Achromatium sp. WMS2]